MRNAAEAKKIDRRTFLLSGAAALSMPFAHTREARAQQAEGRPASEILLDLQTPIAGVNNYQDETHLGSRPFARSRSEALDDAHLRELAVLKFNEWSTHPGLTRDEAIELTQAFVNHLVSFRLSPGQEVDPHYRVEVPAGTTLYFDDMHLRYSDGTASSVLPEINAIKFTGDTNYWFEMREMDIQLSTGKTVNTILGIPDACFNCPARITVRDAAIEQCVRPLEIHASEAPDGSYIFATYVLDMRKIPTVPLNESLCVPTGQKAVISCADECMVERQTQAMASVLSNYGGHGNGRTGVSAEDLRVFTEVRQADRMRPREVFVVPNQIPNGDGTALDLSDPQSAFVFFDCVEGDAQGRVLASDRLSDHELAGIVDWRDYQNGVAQIRWDRRDGWKLDR